jgi:sugar transferase (PEP-CTERM/EpsH1 system associated)
MKGDPRPLILHVVLRFAIGGLENGIVNLINRMPHEKWRHGVIALTDVSDAFCDRVKRSDVSYASFGKPPGHAHALYPGLFRLFRKQRPAIVHTRNLAALEAAVPAWAAGVPVRVHGEHGRDVNDLDGTERRYQWVRRFYRPFVHQYVALSREIETYLIESVRVPSSRVEHIYNGVDSDVFRPHPGGRAPIEGSPFNDPSLFVIGSVGRMEVVKDQTNLARAFVRALEMSPGLARRLRLILVGDGSLREEVESIVRGARIESRVWIAGARDDVASLMAGFNCFVLPSLAEGISNTILEAMATGLPVVATRVGANADLLEDGLSGRLVPRANPDAIADEILAYVSDPALARRHGHAGRQIVERRFSLGRMIERYETMYRSLLDKRGVRVFGTAPRTETINRGWRP